MSKLFIISAPSGAGKTSLVGALINDGHGGRPVTHTTRLPRPSECDGVDYHFVSEADFNKMVENGELLEHATVFGSLYGTSRKALERAMSFHDTVFLVIDWQGAERMRELYPDSISIFIAPPSIEVLRKRLTNRGQDSSSVIERRLREAVRDMRHARNFEHVVVNQDFNEAFMCLLKVVQNDD